MVIATTEWLIATMQYTHSFGDWAVGLHPYPSMHEDMLLESRYPFTPVALAVQTPLPQPTWCQLGCRWWKLSHHTTNHFAGGVTDTTLSSPTHRRPNFLVQAGHAPQPDAANVFSAITICSIDVAKSARDANCSPPIASQVESRNWRPP